MNPKAQGNPFLAALAHMHGGQQGGATTPAPGVNPAMMQHLAQPQPGGPQAPNNPAGGGQGPTPPQGPQSGAQGPQDPSQGGTTKVLLSALQALQQFTQQASDPSEVALVRSIIVLLNQLIQRDQMLQQQQGGGQPGGAPVAAQGGPQAPQGPQQGGPSSAIAQAMAQAQGGQQ